MSGPPARSTPPPRTRNWSASPRPDDAFNDITHRTAAAVIVLFLERLRNGAGLAPIAVSEPL